MKKINYAILKYLIKWTGNNKYPSKARIVFIRDKLGKVEEYENYKSKEDFRKELKRFLYNHLVIYGYDTSHV